MELTLFLCRNCLKEKEKEAFAPYNFKEYKDGAKRNSRICRQCVSIKAKKWNSTPHGKELNRRNIKKRTDLVRNYVYDFLKENPCVDCGATCPIYLDFDHVMGTKEANVSELVRSGFPISTIQAEIDKCEVVCRNCHQTRTAKRGKQFKYLRWVEDNPQWKA